MQKSSDKSPVFITVKELAERWRVERKAVMRAAKRYKDVLKPTKPGKKVLFNVENVELFEEKKRIL